MTIEQMSMLARLFGVLTIIGVIGLTGMFFLLDIKKAFHIVTKSTYKVRKKKEILNAPTIKGTIIKSNVADSEDYVTRVLDMNWQDNGNYEPTAVLGNGSNDETTILGDRVNKLDLIVDITYIPSEVII